MVIWQGDVLLLHASFPGQTHLNSDAKIADQERPQGAPLRVEMGRAHGGEGTHKGCPYFFGQETGLQLPKT